MDKSDLEKISDAIYSLIPEVARLRDIFLKWSALTQDQRKLIDTQFSDWTSLGQIQLYKCVKRALTDWETMQETQGAPGCEPGYYSFPCHTGLEDDLINVLQNLERLLQKLDDHLQVEEAESSPRLGTGAPPSSVSSDGDDGHVLHKRHSEPIRMDRTVRTKIYFHKCTKPCSGDNGYNTD